MLAPLLLWLVSGISPMVAEKPVPFDCGELPDPPESIARLIESARVTFESGPRDEAENSTGSQRIVAETHYNIAYGYNARSKWRIDREDETVVINIRFARIKWEPTHRIWFLKRPATESFWSNTLVLHEFDHVRISNDPRLKTRFEELLRDRSVVTRSIPKDAVVNRKYVDGLVTDHVAEVFAEITDLVSIRYKELDRVTGHGVRPLPNDSALIDLLRPDPADSQ